MTLLEFKAELEKVCPDTYELKAPAGKTRYVVWHRYGGRSVCAGDRNEIDAPKVQIDIVTDRRDDALVDDVSAALWRNCLPYDLISEGYDQEFNAFRTILQLVVI